MLKYCTSYDVLRTGFTVFCHFVVLVHLKVHDPDKLLQIVAGIKAILQNFQDSFIISASKKNGLGNFMSCTLTLYLKIECLSFQVK